ncbi:unnamed protein product, partial [Oppiella nova]
DESAFIVNTSDSDVESTRKKAPKKRIRNVGSKSSSSEDKSDSGDDHSSDEDSDVFDKYSSTRSQRQKENEMKKREKNEKLKKRMDDKKKRKRMEYNSPSDSSQDNDSGEEKRLNWRNWKSKSNPPKKRVRRIVSDDSDDNEVNGNRDHKSLDESHPEVTTTGAVHLVESDDDIEYLGSVPARDLSSSDTESDATVDPNPIETSDELVPEVAPIDHRNNEAVANPTTPPTPVDVGTPQERQSPDSQNMIPNDMMLDAMSESSLENLLFDLQQRSDDISVISDTPQPAISQPVASQATGAFKPQPDPLKVLTPAEGKPTATVAPVQPKPVIPAPPPPPPPPPQPQLPQYCVSEKRIKCPDKMPFRQYMVKNGVQHTIEAPPKLPPEVFIKVIHSSVTLNKVRRLLNSDSDDIETLEETLKVPLNCPLSYQKLLVPGRSVNCPHIDCFDVNNFLEINFNRKIDDWKCPKCKQPAKLEHLIIDGLIDHILNMTRALNMSDVDSVTFDNKAIWRPDVKRPDNLVNKSNEKDVISLDATLESQEIIDLEDDDDEEVPDPIAKTNQLLNSIALKTIASAKDIQKNISKFIQTNKQNSSATSGGNADRELSVNTILNFLTTPAPKTSAPVPPRPAAASRPPPAHATGRAVPATTAGAQQVSRIHIVIPNNKDQRPAATANSRPQNTVRISSNQNPTPIAFNRNSGAVRQSPPNALTNGNQQQGELQFKFNKDNVVSEIYCKLCHFTINVSNVSDIPNLMTYHLKSGQHMAAQSGSSRTAANNSNGLVNGVHRPNAPSAAYTQHFHFGSATYQNQYRPPNQTHYPLNTNQSYSAVNYVYHPNVYQQQMNTMSSVPQPVPPPQTHSAPVFQTSVPQHWNTGQHNQTNVYYPNNY